MSLLILGFGCGIDAEIIEVDDTHSAEPLLCADIEEEIAALNSCETVEDCVAAAHAVCPLGCEVYVNEGFVSLADELLDKWEAEFCSSCDYECAGNPVPACQAGRCVSVH